MGQRRDGSGKIVALFACFIFSAAAFRFSFSRAFRSRF